MSPKSRRLLQLVLTALAAGATTAALDWASARWEARPTEPAAAKPTRELRGRVLGLRWAERPAEPRR